MDPLSRKLFKNSDARQRLAQMGGIVASSPELASTVQRFDLGGLVQPLPPQLRTDPSFVQMASQMGATPDELWAAMSPEARANTISRLYAGIGDRPPMRADILPMDDMSVNPSYTEVRPDVFPDTGAQPLSTGPISPMGPPTAPRSADPAEVDQFTDDMTNFARGVIQPPLLSLQDMYGDTVIPSSPSASPTPTPPVSTTGMERDAASEQAEFYSGLPLNVLRGMGHVVGLDPQTRSILGSAAEDLGARGLGVVSSVLGMPKTGAGLFRQATDARDAFRKAVLGDRPEDLTEAEELLEQDTGTPLEIPEDPAELLPPPAGTAETAETPEPTTDPLAGAADTTANELRNVFGIDPPDRAPRNRRERVEQELDLIKEVFGDRDRNKARERAMNLAMIGLAIAAGQSPDAMVNIAQGLLSGTQAMQQAQAAEREREDALRMQAFETVMGEEREERQFGRQMQRDDRQFGRQMQLAQFKASLAGPASSGTTTPTDPGNLFTTELNRVLGAGLDTPIGMRIAEIKDPAEKEAFALETALQNVLTVSPADTEVDVARIREVEQRVRDRIARLRLTPEQAATLDAARQSLARRPENRDAIESRLRGVGIDPSLL